MGLVAGITGPTLLLDVKRMPLREPRRVESTVAFDSVRRSIIPISIVSMAIEAEFCGTHRALAA